MNRATVLAVALACAGACTDSSNPGLVADPGPAPEAVARTYLGDLAPLLVGRVLSADEVARVDARIAEGMPIPDVVRAALETWSTDPFLAETARDLLQNLLAVSGAREDINFELPGNLARYVVLEGLPWSTILTADYCVGDDLSQIPCDTGAPFTAGVLATRAYQVSRASRFNLTRASTMMHAFACQGYPLPETLEPRVERDRLITMFRANTPDEQEDPSAADAFGNGFACYGCHGQFSSHAQFFVRFDETGLWREDATGIQDPEGELGRATGGLFASHFTDLEEAKSPRSQMFGQPAENLAEGAAILGASPEFVQCSTKNILDYTLRLDERSPIPKTLLASIAEAAAASGEPMTFQRLVVEALSNPVVIDSATAYLYEDAATPDETDAGPDSEEDQP